MVNRVRGVLALAGFAMLAGCQSISSEPAQPLGCGEVPTFVDNVCLLDSWVGFGLEAQRGDDAWRQQAVDRLYGDRPDQKAARAVVLSWDGPGEWREASNLYKASIGEAPPRLQPLLQQWLNELEERRDLYSQRATGRSQPSPGARNAQALKQENEQLKQQLKEMSDKMDALTDIERTINSRD